MTSELLATITVFVLAAYAARLVARERSLRRRAER